MGLAKDFFSVFNTKQRTTLFLLVLFVIVLAILQTTGVGAILPVVTLLVKPEVLLNHPLGELIYQYTGAASTGDFTVLLLMGYSLIYISLQLASSLFNYLQYKFVNYFQLSLSTRMLNGYLANDYLFFLRQNTSVLLKNITQESRTFSCTLVFNILKLLSNGLILLAVALFLIIVAPETALPAFALGGVAYFTLYKSVQRKLQHWSEERDKHLTELNKTAHQALSGAKEIIVCGCEDKYIQDYYNTAIPYEQLNIRYHTISASLPLWMNTAVFGGAVIILGTMQWYGIDVATHLPVLAMIGVGLSRILPLITNIFNALFTIRYYAKSFDTVVSAMKELESVVVESKLKMKETETIPPLSNSISLQDVHFSYRKTSSEILRGVNFTISKGTKVALVGESGAGKSTIMDVLLGLLWSNSGHVKIDGRPLNRDNATSWREQVGYVPQQTFILDSTLRENIAFGLNAEDIDDDEVLTAIRKSKLDNLLATLNEGLDTQLGERGARLSGGEMQRVGIARALYRNPAILILDEPTSSLDAITEQQIINEMIALEKITVIIISHRISSVKFCDSIIVFEKGAVACEGEYDFLVENCAIFESMDNAWGELPTKTTS